MMMMMMMMNPFDPSDDDDGGDMILHVFDVSVYCRVRVLPPLRTTKKAI